MGTLVGHTGFIRALAVLKNGLLASSSEDNTIKIWEPYSATLIKTLTGHSSSCEALAVLDNGLLVSGSDDMTISWII